MTNNSYHIPVFLKDAVDGLNINPEGIYVDVTFGGGGHSREILSRLTTGKLIAFDQDEDAQRNLIDDERFVFIPQNFSFLQNFLKLYGFNKVDGILGDLGVSSHQFDVEERGFSIRNNASLDMRMNQHSELNAWKVVNEYEKETLTKIFREYADLKNAHKVSWSICTARETKTIETTEELMQIIEPYCGGEKKKNQFNARVFQAIRIEVNQEIEVLKSFLEQSANCLNSNGRLVIISYHSLEDRLTKNFFKKGSFDGEAEKDFYGNLLKPLNEITRKPLIPSDEEIERNNRARSAKMRIAEKN